MDWMAVLLAGTMGLFAAGWVKGLVGLGLPTIAMAFLTLVIDPRTALSLILVPMFASNFWQMWRGGEVARTVRAHWRFAAVLVVVVTLTVILSREAGDRLLLGALGIALLLFAFFSWRRMIPEIPDRLVRPGEAASATVTGIIGGLIGGWAAPLAMWLTARRLPPDDFIRASGFLIAAGSLPLLIFYAALGLATPTNLAISTGLLIPTFLGFAAGEMMRRRFSAEGFKTALLVVFLLLGLNLLRRAILGV